MDQTSNDPLLLTNVLNQALKSNDTQLIDFAIAKTPSNLIADSIKALDLEKVQVLQQYIIKKMVSYPHQSNQLIGWIKEIILRGHGDFLELKQAIEERTRNYEKIKALDMKLSTIKKKSQQNGTSMKKAGMIIFVETNETVNIHEEQQQQQMVEEQNSEEVYSDEGEHIDAEFTQTVKALRDQEMLIE